MVRDASVGIRIEKDLKEIAEKAAKDDRRSLASLIEIALVQYLEKNGYLKKGK